MPVCEMCGEDSLKAKRVFVDRALLMLCPNCARFGKEAQGAGQAVPVGPAGPAQSPREASRGLDLTSGRGGPRPPKDGLDDGTAVTLVDDFHKRISRARNALGWTQEELGKRLNERKSVITQLESGKIRPDEKLRKKLEKTLNIKLMERVKEAMVHKGTSTKAYTIGDVLKDK
jgi:putative transcription factor